MKNILVISDSHGRSLGALESETDAADAVIFCGDGRDERLYLERRYPQNSYCVGGNCDGSSEEKFFELFGVKILLTHGSDYGVKSGRGALARRARLLGADAVCFGHTHRPTVENESGVLFLNPGGWLVGDYAFLHVERGKVFGKIMSK